MTEKRSILWKIYFYVLILLLIFFIVTEDAMYVGYYTSEIVYDIFTWIIIVITLIGFWGFIYRKKIFYKDFWIFIFAIEVVDTIGYGVLNGGLTEMLLVLILCLPFYIALYQYAFRMNELWERK